MSEIVIDSDKLEGGKEVTLALMKVFERVRK